MTSVKECSEEVKGCVLMVNETLRDGNVKSEEKLAEYLEKSQFCFFVATTLVGKNQDCKIKRHEHFEVLAIFCCSRTELPI